MNKTDKFGMLNLLVKFPDQCADAFSVGKNFFVPQSYIGAGYKNIVFSGLGGSAIGADLLRSYLADEIKIPVFVNRDYTIPRFVGKDTLFLACSYSGDTEETLSSYAEAKQRGAKVIAMASGGKLGILAKEDKVPVIGIPGGYPPRAALGYSFFGWLDVLYKFGFIADKTEDVAVAIDDMKVFRDSEAKRLARELVGKYIIIYAANKHIDSVVVRWRSQLAENAKTLASTHLFPEMNHNETVGWEGPKKLLKDFVVVLLRDEGEHPRVAKRMDITKAMIGKESKVIEVRSKGRNLLSRMFNLINTGDFTSYYLAVLNGVDPTPVEKIVYLKKELSKLR